MVKWADALAGKPVVSVKEARAYSLVWRIVSSAFWREVFLARHPIDLGGVARRRLVEGMREAVDRVGGASDRTESNPQSGSIGITIAATEDLTPADAFIWGDGVGARRVFGAAGWALDCSPRGAVTEARKDRRRVTLTASRSQDMRGSFDIDGLSAYEKDRHGW